MGHFKLQDEHGDTPLMEACDGGHIATAILLIDKGASIDYKNKVGYSRYYSTTFVCRSLQ